MCYVGGNSTNKVVWFAIYDFVTLKKVLLEMLYICLSILCFDIRKIFYFKNLFFEDYFLRNVQDL